jgi:hypothetical protein
MKPGFLRLRAVAAIVLYAGLALGAHAATTEEDAAIGLIREQFKDVDLQRVIEVSSKMKLDEHSAKRFWPIYQSYLLDIVVMRDRQLGNLGEFARQLNAGWIDDPTARASLARSLELEQAKLDARQRMIRKAGEVLSPTQTLRLYQIELAMDAAIRSRLLEQVPPAQ